MMRISSTMTEDGKTVMNSFSAELPVFMVETSPTEYQDATALRSRLVSDVEWLEEQLEQARRRLRFVESHLDVPTPAKSEQKEEEVLEESLSDEDFMAMFGKADEPKTELTTTQLARQQRLVRSEMLKSESSGGYRVPVKPKSARKEKPEILVPRMSSSFSTVSNKSTKEALEAISRMAALIEATNEQNPRRLDPYEELKNGIATNPELEASFDQAMDRFEQACDVANLAEEKGLLEQDERGRAKHHEYFDRLTAMPDVEFAQEKTRVDLAEKTNVIYNTLEWSMTPAEIKWIKKAADPEAVDKLLQEKTDRAREAFELSKKAVQADMIPPENAPEYGKMLNELSNEEFSKISAIIEAQHQQSTSLEPSLATSIAANAVSEAIRAACASLLGVDAPISSEVAA